MSKARSHENILCVIYFIFINIAYVSKANRRTDSSRLIVHTAVTNFPKSEKEANIYKILQSIYL